MWAFARLGVRDEELVRGGGASRVGEASGSALQANSLAAGCMKMPARHWTLRLSLDSVDARFRVGRPRQAQPGSPGRLRDVQVGRLEPEPLPLLAIFHVVCNRSFCCSLLLTGCSGACATVAAGA